MSIPIAIPFRNGYGAYFSGAINPVQRDKDQSFVDWKTDVAIGVETHLKLISTGAGLLVYNRRRGIWEENGEIVLEWYVRSVTRPNTSIKMVREIVHDVRGLNPVDVKRLGQSKHKIVLENGIYDIETSTFTLGFKKAHKDLHIAAVPITYDKDATCPKTDKFFREIVNEADVQLLYEILAYCFYKDYTFAKFFIMIGEGANGKSVLFDLFNKMLGEDNCSSICLQFLAEDKFSIYSLHGKMANIANDIPNKAIDYTGILKALTGRDKVSANRKFKDPFDFVNYAKMMFSCNQIPYINDSTRAWYRRPVIIHFPNKFEDNDPNTRKSNELLAELYAELPGLFNAAMLALTTLLKRERFTNSKTTEEVELEFTKLSNPMKWFCDTMISQDLNSDPISKKVLYYTYINEVKKIGRDPKAENQFAKELRRFVTYVEQRRILQSDGSQPYMWSGIKLSCDLVELEEEMDLD